MVRLQIGCFGTVSVGIYQVFEELLRTLLIGFSFNFGIRLSCSVSQ